MSTPDLRVTIRRDGLVTLEPRPPQTLHVRCSGCRGRLVDGTEKLWEFARRCGHFPTSCPLCGADLPQWTPVAAGRPRLAARPATRLGEIADVRVSDLRNAERQ